MTLIHVVHDKLSSNQMIVENSYNPSKIKGLQGNMLKKVLYILYWVFDFRGFRGLPNKRIFASSGGINPVLASSYYF